MEKEKMEEYALQFYQMAKSCINFFNEVAEYCSLKLECDFVSLIKAALRRAFYACVYCMW